MLSPSLSALPNIGSTKNASLASMADVSMLSNSLSVGGLPITAVRVGSLAHGSDGVVLIAVLGKPSFSATSRTCQHLEGESNPRQVQARCPLAPTVTVCSASLERLGNLNVCGMGCPSILRRDQ